MAAIKVDPKVREALLQAYADKFGKSPIRLISALNTRFSEDLETLKKQKKISIARDLISDKTIRNFFGDNPPQTLQQSSLNYLCVLLLGFKSYAEAKERISPDDDFLITKGAQATLNIDKLPWLNQYRQELEESLGKIRVLDMNSPRLLNHLFTEVNVFESTRRQKQATIDGLLDSSLEDNSSCDFILDRTGFPRLEKRIGGLAAIQQYDKLIVLGDPGAGKTTFLRYIAINFLSQSFEKLYIPFYLELRDFNISGISLVEKMIQTFDNFLPDARVKVPRFLEEGQCLILLDGLDEVRKADIDYVHNSIQSFVKNYPENRYIITCRSAAHDRTSFENFTLVEVAEFTRKQVRNFVTNWFREQHEAESSTVDDVQVTVSRFLSKLEENKAVQELATNPLLLTMLCYLFQDSYNFPRNRHTLYGDAVEALLRRWDARRRIERHEEYSEYLTRPRKINLFSRIAYFGFDRTVRRTMWKKFELENEIKEFIQHIPAFNSEDLEAEGNIILQEIEENHGILVEKRRELYAFSHLTFQEYFTARFVLDSSERRALLNRIIQDHLTDPSWHEVFLIISGRLDTADEFLKMMFEQANRLIEASPDLQEYLEWLYKMTEKSGCPYSAYRAFYLAVDLDTLLYLRNDVAIDRELCHKFATAIRDYCRTQVRGGKLQPRPPRAGLISMLVAIHAIAEDHAISHLNNPHDHQHDLEDARENHIVINSKRPKFTLENLEIEEGSLEQKLREVITLAKDLEYGELVNQLEILQANLPCQDADGAKCQEWTDQLKQVMIDYLDVGYEKPISEEDSQALQDYLYGCHLVLECIQGDSYVSKDLRESLISSFLLPSDLVPSRVKPSVEKEHHL
jgi:hypothetical protein